MGRNWNLRHREKQGFQVITEEKRCVLVHIYWNNLSDGLCSKTGCTCYFTHLLTNLLPDHRRFIQSHIESENTETWSLGFILYTFWLINCRGIIQYGFVLGKKGQKIYTSCASLWILWIQMIFLRVHMWTAVNTTIQKFGVSKIFLRNQHFYS